MRPALKWAFSLSTAASAIALLWPVADSPSLDVSPTTTELPKVGAIAALRLPEMLPAQDLQPTAKDPFASLLLVKPIPPAPSVPLPAPPPEPVRAPPLTYRYLGSFTNPQGAREIYLSNNSRTVPVRQGSQLDGGYEVETIGATSIKVLHGATQTRVDIPIVQNKETP